MAKSKAERVLDNATKSLKVNFKELPGDPITSQVTFLAIYDLTEREVVDSCTVADPDLYEHIELNFHDNHYADEARHLGAYVRRVSLENGCRYALIKKTVDVSMTPELSDLTIFAPEYGDNKWLVNNPYKGSDSVIEHKLNRIIKNYRSSLSNPENKISETIKKAVAVANNQEEYRFENENGKVSFTEKTKELITKKVIETFS